MKNKEEFRQKVEGLSKRQDRQHDIPEACAFRSFRFCQIICKFFVVYTIHLDVVNLLAYL